MKQRLSFVLLCSLLATSATQAQLLVKDYLYHPEQYNEGYYDVEPSFVYHEEFGIETLGYDHFRSPFIARSTFEKTGLTLPEEAQQRPIAYSGTTDEGGHYAVVELQGEIEGVPNYFLYIYDGEGNHTLTTSLTMLAEREGLIEQLIYDRGRFYYNITDPFGMGGPEHFSNFMLFCFDPVRNDLVWESNVCVSSSSFLLLDDYIVAGYGGSGVDDFITLIDRQNGLSYSTNPMPSAPAAIGTTNDNEGLGIWFTDYKGILYRYRIASTGIRVTGSGVRMRQGPSTSDPIYNDPFTQRPCYPLEGDVLPYLGEEGDWYRVSFMGEELYISKQFSMRYDGEANSVTNRMLRDMIAQKLKEHDDSALRHPIFFVEQDIDGEGASEVLAITPSFTAVFTGNDKERRLVAQDTPLHLSIYPGLHAVRTYEGLSTGYEYEMLYFLKGDRVAEVWNYYSNPLGNIHEEDEVAVEQGFTRTIGNGKPQPITEEEYFAKRRLFDDAETFDYTEVIDL